MLIKNTKLNELREAFKRDRDFCPFNEEELERLKKEAELLRDKTTNYPCFNFQGAEITYKIFSIRDKGVCYKFEQYGILLEIDLEYPEGRTENVTIYKTNNISFVHEKKGQGEEASWRLEVSRSDGKNLFATVWVAGEPEFLRPEF